MLAPALPRRRPPSLLRRMLLLACMAGMACARGAPPAAGDPILEDRDAGRALLLRVGDRFDVRLEGTPGTGYAWEVAELGDAVAQRGPPASQALEPVRPGTAARETFRFEARRPGTARLRLVYRRPWDRDAAPVRTFAVDVTVR